MTDDICISINGTSHPILCGSCKRKIAFIGKSDGDGGKAGCSTCTNVAEVQEVANSAVEYAKDEGQLILNRIAKETARKSKIMTFNGQTTHNKSHRFVVDLHL